MCTSLSLWYILLCNFVTYNNYYNHQQNRDTKVSVLSLQRNCIWPLRSIHVTQWVISSFVRLNNIPWCGCTVVYLFIPLLKGRHWGSFSFSVQFSQSVVSDSLWPHGLQHARPPCPSPTPGVHLNPCRLSWWCHPTISSSSSPSPPALKFSQHQGLFQWISSSHQVAKVLEFQLQHQSFQSTPRTNFL